jgi:hypothetical protein
MIVSEKKDIRQNPVIICLIEFELITYNKIRP